MRIRRRVREGVALIAESEDAAVVVLVSAAGWLGQGMRFRSKCRVRDVNARAAVREDCFDRRRLGHVRSSIRRAGIS